MTPNVSDANPTAIESLPDGNYALVFYDLSITGFRLIDEIIDIGAYCGNREKFSSVIMPYCDLPEHLQGLYGMRVVTIGGKYRELKDCLRNAIIPSRSEFAALNDFLDWLKKVKEDKDGVVLVGFDMRKNNVVHLVQAFMRYGLFEAFTSLVKGFADLCDADKSARSCRRYIIAHMEDNQLCLDAAIRRASYLYKAFLAQAKIKEPTYEDVKPYTFSTALAVAELNKIKEYVSKEANLKPIFSYYFGPRTRMGVRSYAARLRRLLVDADLEFASLAETFARKGGKDGVREIVTESVKGKTEDVDTLVEIISTHFDPQMQRKDMPTLIRQRASESKNENREKRRRRSRSRKSRSRSVSQKGKKSISKEEETDSATTETQKEETKGEPTSEASQPLEELGVRIAEMALTA